MRLQIAMAGSIVAGLLLCGTAAAQVGKDRIKTVDSKFFTGTISEESYEKVTYKVGDVQASLSQQRVAEITWGDMPADYHTAELHRKRGEYAEAVERYLKALDSPVGRAFWLKPYTMFFLGTCYESLGELAKAEEQFAQLTKDYPMARFFPDANIELGRIYLKQSKWDAAAAAFKVIIGKIDPYTGRSVFKDELYYLARLMNTDALVGKKQYDQAVNELSKLISETEAEYSVISLWARQKKARVKVVSGTDFHEGINEYQQIIEKAVGRMKQDVVSSEESRLMQVVCQCYNGLGDAYREHGKGDDRVKHALLHYLRVATVLAAAADGDDLVHALKWAGWCYKQIGNEERAAALESELKSRFPKFPTGS